MKEAQQEQQQPPRRVGVRGALASPRHVLWARDQLAALLACAAVPRCGAGSPASLVPHHVLACDVGQRFVTHVARTSAICGSNLVSADDVVVVGGGVAGATTGCRYYTDVPTDGPFDVVCVGVSLTLGVVECRGWTRIQSSVSMCAWMGVIDVLGIGGRSNIEVVDHVGMTFAEEEVVGFGNLWGYIRICRGTKWAVLYTFDHVGRVAVRPLGLHDGVNRVVDVRGHVEWVDMIHDDEAALLIRIVDLSSTAKFTILCVDLEKSYQSGQLVVTDSFPGFGSLQRMVFHSKGHKLIVPMIERRNKSHVFELRSLRTLKVLHTCSDLLFHKVDNTHFAEEDRTNRTLSVFSTDDFETPVCIFAINGKFKCGNGFIALVQQEEGCVDLVDAVTGTWLLRQPFLSRSHTELQRRRLEQTNHATPTTTPTTTTIVGTTAAATTFINPGTGAQEPRVVVVAAAQWHGRGGVLRDQLVAMLLVSTHPRGGTHNDNSNNKWNHFHLALKVLWEWLMEAQSNVSLRVDSGKEVITFGFSPITGSITRGVTCWRDVRTGVTGKLVSVNTQNALHARQGNAGHYSWELTSLATGERVGLWEGADGSVKAVANEKWLLEWLERGSRLAITPTCGMDAGSRRVVDVPQALVLPKFYLRSSSLNLFFNRAADDEAVLMFFGEARTQELPSLVSLRLVCIAQTWATKSLTKLSSTRSVVYTCPSSAVVCQSRLLGGAHTFVVITQHPDRRGYATVIEEGTGRQTTLLTRVRDKGKVCYAMSLGQLSDGGK
ncbi:hypothetical protein Pelo_18428 [Pelomyxa schiedti]|nr:hypothetical protein Pelo_18428 [Pelomyxa schiedti]